MYHCTDCNRVFEELDYYTEDPSPPGIALPYGYYTYYICPYCGSGYWEEISDDEEDWEDDWVDEDEFEE